MKFVKTMMGKVPQTESDRTKLQAQNDSLAICKKIISYLYAFQAFHIFNPKQISFSFFSFIKHIKFVNELNEMGCCAP